MKIYGFATQNNGCAKYRIWTPLDAIQRQGLAKVEREPDDSGTISVERADYLFREHDIVFCQPFSQLWAATIFMAARDEHRKKLIVDLDDNVWAVHPMNVGEVKGKLTFMKSHFEGEFKDFWELQKIPKQQMKKYQKRIDGTVVKRDDGTFHFLKEKRPDVKLTVEFMLQNADAVTTTNETLADVIRQHTDRPVYSLPNCLDLRNRPKATVAADKKWVGWCGSVSHYPDLKPLVPALDNLTRKHPDLNVQMMGSSFDYLFPMKEGAKARPVVGYGHEEPLFYTELANAGERWPGRMRFDKPVPVQEYDEWLRTNWISQVGLAPIEANAFNDAKSELKWLEYTALGIPTIASDFGPYKRAIRHGHDGFLVKWADWWEITIDAVLKKPEVGRVVAQNAMEKLKKHYEINTQCQKWMEVFNCVSSSPGVADSLAVT